MWRYSVPYQCVKTNRLLVITVLIDLNLHVAVVVEQHSIKYIRSYEAIVSCTVYACLLLY